MCKCTLNLITWKAFLFPATNVKRHAGPGMHSVSTWKITPKNYQHLMSCKKFRTRKFRKLCAVGLKIYLSISTTFKLSSSTKFKRTTRMLWDVGMPSHADCWQNIEVHHLEYPYPAISVKQQQGEDGPYRNMSKIFQLKAGHVMTQFQDQICDCPIQSNQTPGPRYLIQVP